MLEILIGVACLVIIWTFAPGLITGVLWLALVAFICWLIFVILRAIGNWIRDVNEESKYWFRKKPETPAVTESEVLE